MSTKPHRTARGISVLVAVLLVLGPGRAGAAPAQAVEPEVTITASSGAAFSATDCRGTPRTEITQAITVTISRTGDTSGPLVVSLSYGGSLAGSSGLPAQATIPAGASTITLTANDASNGNLTITVIDGVDYAVGLPDSAQASVNLAIADLGCNLGDVRTEQTIEVGTAPAAIDLMTVAYHPPSNLARSIEGQVPPGTTYHLDGTWDGVATEVGVSFFREYFCDDDGWCPYRADIKVTVIPAGAAPDPTPAAPAAAPVTGTPELTG